MESPGAEPRGRSWGYNFQGSKAEGEVSVSFKTPVEGIGVNFRPKASFHTESSGRLTPLVCIQMFDHTKAKNQDSREPAELTTFGDDNDKRGIGSLILIIDFSNTNGQSVNFIELSAPNASAKINVKDTGTYNNPPFHYTILSIDRKKPRFELEIHEWPAGDPLISYG